MKASMQTAIAILVGAVSQALVIVYVGQLGWAYETIADLLPPGWLTPILTFSMLSAPFGVVVTLTLSDGLRQTANHFR